MMLILIILIVFVIAYAVKYPNVGRHDRSSSSGNRALDILNERYAMGEISDEEYSRRKSMLKE